MKRSEMIAAIHQRMNGTMIDHDNYADQFLSVVEELGMLPPIESYRCVMDLDLGVPEWEDENET